MPSAAAAPPSLSLKLARALAVPHVRAATSAALAVELETGRVVFSRNANVSLVPASTEKLAVAYAVLRTLGPQHRIPTHVLGLGQQRGSVFLGQLVLKGFGDPTLEVERLRLLAAQIRRAGIRRVTGSVMGDESFFDAKRTAPGWKSRFYIGESPPLSALVVDRGRYRGRTNDNPALAAASIFRSVLRDAGVLVASRSRVGVAPVSAPVLASLESPPLAAVVRFMGQESDNFTAEMLLKQLGAAGKLPGTTLAGARHVRRALLAAGVPLAGVRVVDGSGLSVLDRVTATTLVAILRAAWADPRVRPAFVASLPLAGVTGTLDDRMERPPVRGAVRAKTGTTMLASALSGFVRGRYAFAVLHNGQPVSHWWARRAQDRFVSVLATQ